MASNLAYLSGISCENRAENAVQTNSLILTGYSNIKSMIQHKHNCVLSARMWMWVGKTRAEEKSQLTATGVERTDRQLLITPRDQTSPVQSNPIRTQTEQNSQTQTCVGLPNPVTPTHAPEYPPAPPPPGRQQMRLSLLIPLAVELQIVCIWRQQFVFVPPARKSLMPE